MYHSNVVSLCEYRNQKIPYKKGGAISEKRRYNLIKAKIILDRHKYPEYDQAYSEVLGED